MLVGRSVCYQLDFRPTRSEIGRATSLLWNDLVENADGSPGSRGSWKPGERKCTGTALTLPPFSLVTRDKFPILSPDKFSPSKDGNHGRGNAIYPHYFPLIPPI